MYLSFLHLFLVIPVKCSRVCIYLLLCHCDLFLSLIIFYIFIYYRSPSHSSPNSQDRAGPSELQSFSDSLKSRFNAMSSRYDIYLMLNIYRRLFLAMSCFVAFSNDALLPSFSLFPISLYYF